MCAVQTNRENEDSKQTNEFQCMDANNGDGDAGICAVMYRAVGQMAVFHTRDMIKTFISSFSIRTEPVKKRHAVLWQRCVKVSEVAFVIKQHKDSPCVAMKWLERW